MDIITTFNNCKALASQIDEFVKGKKTDLSKGNADLDNKTEVKISDIPEDLLKSLSTEFGIIVEFINSYLLSKQKAELYANILMSLHFEINYNQRGILDIILTKEPAVISFNPMFIGNYTVNELITLVIDEMLKLVFDHPAFYAKLNQDKNQDIHNRLEMASDANTSEIISRDISIDDTNNILHIPSDKMTSIKLEKLINESNTDQDGKNKRISLRGSETFQYYFEAAKRVSNPPNPSGQGQGQGQENSSSGNSQSLASPNNDQGQNVHNWENQSEQDAKESTKNIVRQAINNMSERSKGNLPASIQEAIDKLFEKPKLNWKQILRKYIGIIPEGHRPSKLRLNRRQPERFDLRGTMTNKTIRLVVAIDTSGSMSSEDLKYCFNEIFNILKNKKYDMTIIECDSEIGRVYKTKTIGGVNLKVTGRGGTSFIPVINYINKNKFRDAVMIYFTDGYGDYKIPKPLTYKNLWVIVGGSESSLSVENSYGEVRALRDDTDYKRY